MEREKVRIALTSLTKNKVIEFTGPGFETIRWVGRQHRDCVTISQVYWYVKTNQTMHFKYVQIIVYQLSPNKEAKIDCCWEITNFKYYQ